MKNSTRMIAIRYWGKRMSQRTRISEEGFRPHLSRSNRCSRVFPVLAALFFLQACDPGTSLPSRTSTDCADAAARLVQPKVQASGAMVLVTGGCRNHWRPGRPVESGDSSFCVGSYWIDSTELTIGQFSDLMGRNPSFLHNELYPQAFPVCPTCPQENMTWFEAVLAANARTKKELRPADTVYTYTAIEYTIQTVDSTVAQSLVGYYRMRPRFVSGIKGLGIDTSRAGYRLPSNEEWTFAGMLGYNPFDVDVDYPDSIHQWTSSNSATATTHPVGTKSPTFWGLYDMKGNAWEWTEGRIALGGGWVGPSSMVFDLRSGTSTAGVRFVRKYSGGSVSSVMPRGCR